MTAAACLAALTLTIPSAFADPTGPAVPPHRPLNGTGSPTTQDVMNGLSNVIVDGSGNKLISSWNSSPAGSSITTGIGPVNNPACTITRPTDTLQGIAALIRSQRNGSGGAPDGCLQFARADFVPTVFSNGHIDLLDIDYASGNLSLNIRDSTVIPVNDNLPPHRTLLDVLPGARNTVPSGSSFACLGTAGAPVYLLPQTQDINLLWPGWDTNDVPAAALTNDKVAVELVSSTMPAGARFALYTTNLGNASFMFNTNTAPGCQITSWPGGGLSRGTHGHGWWAFSAPGIYTLTFRATATTTGGVPKSSGDQTYTFVVG
jgi:surface-anchored protein